MRHIIAILVSLALAGCGVHIGDDAAMRALKGPTTTWADIQIVTQEPAPESTFQLTHAIWCDDPRAIRAIEHELKKHGMFRGWMFLRIVTLSQSSYTPRQGMGGCGIDRLADPLPSKQMIERDRGGLLISAPPDPNAQPRIRYPTAKDTPYPFRG